MIKNIYFSFMALVLVYTTAWCQDTVRAEIDLINVQNDQVRVKIFPPRPLEDTIAFHIPKIVPGTYSISDFGRFVSDFTAIADDGDTLLSNQISTNKWELIGGQELAYITYLVDDSFDKAKNYKSNYIFEPGGTSIEKEEDVYVINTFGFIGYIEGLKMSPYQLTIQKRPGLYGSTALEASVRTDSMDVFEARNYNFLADGPLLYCQPDTTSRKIAGADILISVYSPRNKLSSAEVMDNLYDLMVAQSKYLGGKLPVDRYAYLIYLTDKSPLSGSMGALEHSYSSLYFLPEAMADQISQTVRDVAAHEFLHIVTPLNIHSEEIHNFDYINPDMSRHLWLYEGVTEYSSMHVQVRNGLYDFETFLNEIRRKILVAENYPSVSFTKMSENILEPEFENMYQNVYYKGALIAMCLDLYLIKYSDGKMDLPRLLEKLSEKYGPTEPFKDEQLFDDIEKLTFPEVRDFLDTHVKGDAPLPLKECLSWAGILYAEEKQEDSYTLGNIGLSYDRETDRLQVADISDMNEFGDEMGYEEGDLLMTINKQEITVENASDIINNYSQSLEDGQKVKIEVLREKDGKYKKMKLKARAVKVTQSAKHVLEQMKQPTTDQKRVQSVWKSGK